jgi:ATP-dependent Clp protease ATP-binding subunit ClpB
LDGARKHKNEYGDEFVSVEHILQAFSSDKRFGQQLFRDLKINGNDLKDAISAVRGSQRVTDQSMSQLHIVFPMCILGSFA